ncbi:MAG: ABC transporter permease [Longimicrobiales bacterium]|nr:ABC transporter permease [Longimicrobiales bacterium]
MIRARWWGPLVGVGLALAITSLALALGGYDVSAALAALWRGAFGSEQAIASFTLKRSVPLLLTGLAVALAFRAGIWNIGAEGQLYAGAVAGFAVGFAGGGLPAPLLLPLVLLASLMAGAVWAALPALLRSRNGTNEVITTLLLNFVALHLTGWLVQGALQEPRGVFNESAPLPTAAHLPTLWPGTDLHIGFALAIGAAGALWAIFRFTRAGFLIRAIGEGPEAARITGGVRSNRLATAVFLASGALAGLAGAVQVTGVDRKLYDALSPGWGYTAIAVALLARLNPLAVIATAIFFGALQAGAAGMQRSAGVPFAWVTVVEAIAVLGVLIAARERTPR